MPRNNRQLPTLEELQARTVTRKGCWEWTGDRSENGYGRIMRTLGDRQVTLRVHRISYELHHGPIPEGHNVLHRCDNPPCWNPDHLFTGTQAENMADMRKKARTQRGSEKKLSKLTEAQAIQIKSRRLVGERPTWLAKEFGISRAVIRDIVAGKTWKYINAPKG